MDERKQDKVVEAFKELFVTAQTILGPGGCPWDKKQTLHSLRRFVLEEVHELIEAIDLEESEKICDELGDLFFNALFFCFIAERESRFQMEDALIRIREKLIRRHPHVFGDVRLEDNSQIVKQWERIKSSEKEHLHRKSKLDGIPKGLPSLSRAQKMEKKMESTQFSHQVRKQKGSAYQEEEIGWALWDIVVKAQENSIDAEQALGKVLSQLEQAFRTWEESL